MVRGSKWRPRSRYHSPLVESTLLATFCFCNGRPIAPPIGRVERFVTRRQKILKQVWPAGQPVIEKVLFTDFVILTGAICTDLLSQDELMRLLHGVDDVEEVEDVQESENENAVNFDFSSLRQNRSWSNADPWTYQWAFRASYADQFVYMLRKTAVCRSTAYKWWNLVSTKTHCMYRLV